MTRTQMKTNVVDDSAKSTIYITPDGTMRTETPDPVHQTTKIVITNSAKDLMVILDVRTKTGNKMVGFTQAAREKRYGTAAPEKTPLGTETILGFPCEGFSTTTQGYLVSKSWLCTDPGSGAKFVGRSEVTNGTFVMEKKITNVTKEVSVPSSLFEIPSDYQLTVSSAPK